MNALTQAAPELFVGALLNASIAMASVGERLSTPTEVHLDMANASRLLQKMREVRTATNDWIARLEAADPAAVDADLEATAALLLTIERQCATARSVFHRRLDQIRKAAGKAGHSTPPLHQIASRMDAAWVLLLTAARDLRWAVMAAQAVQAPRPDPDSPLMSTPDDIRQWLAALPAEA